MHKTEHICACTCLCGTCEYTVFARSVAAATNVFNLCGGRPLFKSGYYSRAAFIYLTVLSPKN